MKLHGQDVPALIEKSFIGTVIQVPEGGNCDFLRNGRLVHGIPVVLGRDIDPARPEILHRMVRSPVPEFQLVGAAAHCERHELMAETDCKNRKPGKRQLSDLPDHIRIIRRIARTVRDHDPVRLIRKDLFSRRK